MTRITFYEQGGSLQGFLSQGHAGAGDAGYDLVCAAISAEVTCCINSLESIAGIVPIVKLDEKRAIIEAKLPKGLTDAQMHDCQIIIKVLQQGMKDLYEQYPQYINLGGKSC